MSYGYLLFCFCCLVHRNIAAMIASNFSGLFLVESNHLRKFNVTISPNQLADDFRQLRQHLRTSFPEVEQVLVGPDVTQPRGKALKYLER